MDIELLIIEDCPHAPAAALLLRQALDEIGLVRLPITTTVVASDQEARVRGFVGSPSFFADGHDLLADGVAAHARACRLYLSEAGISPLPELRQLRQALERAADGCAHCP